MYASGVLEAQPRLAVVKAAVQLHFSSSVLSAPRPGVAVIRVSLIDPVSQSRD